MADGDHLPGEAMSQYEYIEHALANYFAAGIGQSEEDAVGTLQRHMAASPELADGLRSEVRQALADPAYSWRDALAEHDVLTVEDEGEARQYARKLLGAL
jgi:hypothetical protein